MKQRDTFAIAMIAIIVAIGGWLLTGQLIATPENLTAKVEKVSPYTTDFSSEAKQQLTQKSNVNFSRDPNLDVDGNSPVLTPRKE
jgi:hypothetical protein